MTFGSALNERSMQTQLCSKRCFADRGAFATKRPKSSQCVQMYILSKKVHFPLFFRFEGCFENFIREKVKLFALFQCTLVRRKKSKNVQFSKNTKVM